MLGKHAMIHCGEEKRKNKGGRGGSTRMVVFTAFTGRKKQSEREENVTFHQNGETGWHRELWGKGLP